MKLITAFKILGLIGLLLTILPAVLYFFDKMALDRVKFFMMIGMVSWFLGSIMFWISKRAEVKS